MANAAILYNDKIAAAVLSGDATSATMPVTNMQDDQPGRAARFLAGSAWFLADFQTATAIGAVALAGTNLTATATMRCRMGSTSACSDWDSGTIDPKADVRFGLACYLFDAARTYRYLHVDVADAALSFIDIGLALAGPVFSPARNFSYGWGVETADLSIVQRSRRGQAHVAEGAAQRALALEFRSASEAEAYAEVREMQRIAGNRKNVFVCPRPGATYDANDRIVGLLSDNNSLVQPSFNIFRYRFRVEERL